MNYWFFAIKRTFHATLRITRRLAARFCLTPARADMLYAIFRVPVAPCMGPPGRGVLTQRELRTALGVSAPTVSRMIRSLEALGFVKRCPSGRDRRTLDIRLTDFGWHRVRVMFYEIFKWDLLGVALHCAFAVLGPWANAEAANLWRDQLYGLTTRIRFAFHDRATLEYPGVDPESDCLFGLPWETAEYESEFS